MAQYQIDNIASPIDWQEQDAIKRTVQNAKNLLMCRMGEVPYERYMGFDPALFNKPIEEVRTELLVELDRVMMWEPDVEVVDAEATLMSSGELFIKCIIEIGIDERVMT